MGSKEVVATSYVRYGDEMCTSAPPAGGSRLMAIAGDPSINADIEGDWIVVDSDGKSAKIVEK